MILDIQFKIKNNSYYTKYIREHSNWYKILNRNHLMFKNFEQEVKEVYKLRPTDRVEKALNTFEILQNLLTTMK